MSERRYTTPSVNVAMEVQVQLGSFKPKAVQGLYAFEHFEAPNGMWIQLPANLRPIGPCNEAIFSYGAEDTRPHVRFDKWDDLTAFVEAL